MFSRLTKVYFSRYEMQPNKGTEKSQRSSNCFHYEPKTACISSFLWLQIYDSLVCFCTFVWKPLDYYICVRIQKIYGITRYILLTSRFLYSFVCVAKNEYGKRWNNKIQLAHWSNGSTQLNFETLQYISSYNISIVNKFRTTYIHAPCVMNWISIFTNLTLETSIWINVLCNKR